MSVENAQTAFLAGVDGADPTKLVTRAVRTGALDDWFESREYPKPIHVIALGKAAPRMVWGLIEANAPFTGIGVTTPGQRKPTLEKFWHVGGHPMPNDDSFAAGQAVFDWVDRLPKNAKVLVLLSGGASACVDVAEDPAAVTALNQKLLASGEPIDVINSKRQELSQFKAGGLGNKLLGTGADVRVWVLSDVPPGMERLVGSGPCDLPEIKHDVVGTSKQAERGAAEILQALGYQVETRDRLEGDTNAAVEEFCSPPLAPKQARIAAGETVHPVVPGAPAGGRCHHAAIAAAAHLPNGCVFFAGATDGQDGTTGAAGAWSQKGDFDAASLAACDTFRVLEEKGQSLRIGATGTNVNDLWVLLQE